jgi:sec-independent protein translocase protein TatB
MSGIGFSELIILFLIGLIVLGPERLPRVANQLGTWLGQARRMTRVMKRQLEEEIDFDLEGKSPNIKPPPAQPAPHDDDSYSPLHDPIPMADADDTDADEAQEKKDA